MSFSIKWGSPNSSAGKESACNAGDPGSIPGLGRSAGEGIGYPLQYSWAFLVAQTVKNLPAVRETWVQSLGWEDPLEEGKAIHSSILAWRVPWTEEPGRLQFMGSQRVDHDLATFTSLPLFLWISYDQDPWPSKSSALGAALPYARPPGWGAWPQFQKHSVGNLSYIFQFIDHSPGGYEIWLYCKFTPPTILLWLCLWM